jgi:hypothetical protein
VFHQRQDNPREFMLYEQWRDEAALDAHVAHCQAVFGPPSPNGRLPLALSGLCDDIHTVRYEVVA